MVRPSTPIARRTPFGVAPVICLKGRCLQCGDYNTSSHKQLPNGARNNKRKKDVLSFSHKVYRTKDRNLKKVSRFKSFINNKKIQSYKPSPSTINFKNNYRYR